METKVGWLADCLPSNISVCHPSTLEDRREEAAWINNTLMASDFHYEWIKVDDCSELVAKATKGLQQEDTENLHFVNVPVTSKPYSKAAWPGKWTAENLGVVGACRTPNRRNFGGLCAQRSFRTTMGNHMEKLPSTRHKHWKLNFNTNCKWQQATETKATTTTKMWKLTPPVATTVTTTTPKTPHVPLTTTQYLHYHQPPSPPISRFLRFSYLENKNRFPTTTIIAATK